MKLKKYIYGVALGTLSLTYASCYNADNEFPDYEGGTTAYFAYQFPVRTLILGNDIYDNTLDNDHKCRIWSTMGGAYNGRDAYVDVVVDESLCENVHFVDAGGNAAAEVLPLPSDHYTLLSNTIPYKGDMRGYVEVQFTDKFFQNEKTIKNTYVIPLRMTNVKGIDHINVGKPLGGYNPARVDLVYWEKPAMDYVLYCVKYKNPWDAKYIRRGVDKVTQNGATKTIVRRDTKLVNTDLEHYKENPVNANDEVCSIVTKNMTQAIFPVSFKTSGASVSCNLILTFDGNNCAISSDDSSIKISGSGEYIEKGTAMPEYKDFQWGSLDGKPVQRDILRLAYNVNFGNGAITVSTADTLVVQTRESNKKEFFETKYVHK